MLFIAHTAVALSDNTFIWVCLKWLYKLLRPNKTALSTKTTCKGAIGIHLVQSLRPWFFFIKNCDASVFDKRVQFEICIGQNESSILFIHHKMSIFPACETSIFLSKFPLENSNREFCHVPMTCNAMGQNALQKYCS